MTTIKLSKYYNTASYSTNGEILWLAIIKKICGLAFLKTKVKFDPKSIYRMLLIFSNVFGSVAVASLLLPDTVLVEFHFS